jgi:leucyl/phenylalanyl-tRNA--protein transferase
LDEFFLPEIVLNAYKEGYFPMADGRHGEIYWHSPDPRAVFPLDSIKIPKNMQKKLRRGDFRFTVNGHFDYVIEQCADRSETWINDDIIETYTEMNRMGNCHSVEAHMNGEIVGGLYGVQIGGAFFGESMFNDVSDASKAAFYYLVERLKALGFILLDSQYINPFTEKLGAIEIPRDLYLIILKKAIILPCKFE